jgi:hypothetical protein
VIIDPESTPEGGSSVTIKAKLEWNWKSPDQCGDKPTVSDTVSFSLVKGDCGCSGGDANAPGSCQAGVKSVHIQFGLGRDDRNQSAGQLVIDAESPDDKPASVSALKYYAGRPSVTVSKMSGSGLVTDPITQVLSKEAFVQVTVSKLNGYSLGFYHPGDLVYTVDTQTGLQGPPAVDQFGQMKVKAGTVPFVRWTVSNPTNDPKVVEVTNGTTTYTFSSVFVESGWK